MKKQYKGIPLGEFPPLVDGDRIIYKTPPEYMDRGSNQLIMLGKGNSPDTFVMTFHTWERDYRFKDPKGTWTTSEFNLNKKQLHALQRMNFGGL